MTARCSPTSSPAAASQPRAVPVSRPHEVHPSVQLVASKRGPSLKGSLPIKGSRTLARTPAFSHPLFWGKCEHGGAGLAVRRDGTDVLPVLPAPPGLGAVTTCGDTGRRPPRTARPAPRSSCAAARPAACPDPAGPPGRPRGRSSASPGSPGAERGRPAAWIRAMPACGACERQRDVGEPRGALPVLPPFAPSRDAVDVRGRDSPEGIRQHVAPIEGVDGAPRGRSSLALQEGAPGASQQLALGMWGWH